MSRKKTKKPDIRVTSVTVRGQPLDTPEAKQVVARALLRLPAPPAEAAPTRPSSVRVVAVVMADGSDPESPENLARIQRAILSTPRAKKPATSEEDEPS